MSEDGIGVGDCFDELIPPRHIPFQSTARRGREVFDMSRAVIPMEYRQRLFNTPFASGESSPHFCR
jgi:hypothetical protein